MQKTVKRDLQSFECELAEQRKMLYVEVGLHKEAQSNLLLTYSSLERSHNTETCALDKRIHDLECEIKSMKEITRKDNEERGGNITSSELSKEVINALVTEVILAETIDRRNKEVLDSSALLVKQQEHLSLLNQGAEERMAAQLEAYKSAFKAEMCAMIKQLEIGHAESVQSMKKSALDAAEWQVKQEGQMRDLQRVLIDQDDTQAEVIKQLRDELSKKSDELSTTIATIRDNERVSAERATAAASAVRSDLVNLQMAVEGLLKDRDKEQGTVARNASDTTALDTLTAEVAKVGSKASDAQTALAKMHVRSMYMQDEVKAASDAAKDIRSLVAELAASVELLEKKEAAPPPPVAHMQQVSGEQFKRLETRMDTAVTAVNAVVSAARKENEVGSKKMADDLSAFHIRMTEEIKSLRSALTEKEGVAKQKESNPLPAAEAESLKRYLY